MGESTRYLITNIMDRHTQKRREDGRYPQRVGSIVTLEYLAIGYPMIINYISDNQGKDKDGSLRTSFVLDVTTVNGYVTVETNNSIYVFKQIKE